MTDRELLERAAKAAGYWNAEFHCYQGPLNWDPLADDGDALRLAVKVGMNIALIPPTFQNAFCEVAAGFDDSGWPDVREHELHNGHPAAATRRAIVRAASATVEGGAQ